MAGASEFLEELIELIGEAAMIRLAEEFGGTRLYVPAAMGPAAPIARAVGMEAAARLAAQYSPDKIKVPLARELRASHYHASGLSYARIAVRLGMTETGVEKLMRRLRGS